MSRERSVSILPHGLLAAAVFVSSIGTRAGSAQAPELTRGPYLQSLLEDSVRVIFLTEFPALGRVRYRVGNGPARTVEDPAPATRHELHLTGLAPATRHDYEVLLGDTVVAAGHGFRTAPPAGTGRFRAVVIGDSGHPLEPWQRSVTEMIGRLEWDLFLHTGDIVYTGGIDRAFFDEYRRLLSRVGIFPARGNHSGIRPDQWFELFRPPPVDLVLPPCELPPAVCNEDPPVPGRAEGERTSTFYSLDWGPAHIAVLDSNADFSECSIQMKWLCVDLEAARERRMPWLILVVHEPPYTTGAHHVANQNAARLIPPLADFYDVDLVLSGHDHNYQRTHPLRGGAIVDAWQDPSFVRPGGTIYVVSGGGGALRYPEIRDAPDRPLVRIFHFRHHALELEVSPTLLRARALGPAADGFVVLDDWSIRKSGDRPEPGFRRGDANLDRRVDISDAIALLGVLFLGRQFDCPPAFPVVGNVNSSGEVDIADPVYLLNHLFQGGPPPAEPFTNCEAIPGIDAFLCARASCALR